MTMCIQQGGQRRRYVTMRFVLVLQRAYAACFMVEGAHGSSEPTTRRTMDPWHPGSVQRWLSSATPQAQGARPTQQNWDKRQWMLLYYPNSYVYFLAETCKCPAEAVISRSTEQGGST
eukprot:scaffold130488_cov17-Tisochrysis_lutea.AAC.1